MGDDMKMSRTHSSWYLLIQVDSDNHHLHAANNTNDKKPHSSSYQLSCCFKVFGVIDQRVDNVLRHLHRILFLRSRSLYSFVNEIEMSRLQ